MSWKLRESFVRHPSAILFLRISGEGVFQQPRLLTTVEPRICPGDREALDFPPEHGTRAGRGHSSISLPRSAGLCQRGFLCVYSCDLLGMVFEGRESSPRIARTAARFASLCIHPFAALWSEGQERPHFGDHNRMRASCSGNLLAQGRTTSPLH